MMNILMYLVAKDYIDEVKNDFYCSKELEKMETLDPSYEESWLGLWRPESVYDF